MLAAIDTAALSNCGLNANRSCLGNRLVVPYTHNMNLWAACHAIKSWKLLLMDVFQLLSMVMALTSITSLNSLTSQLNYPIIFSSNSSFIMPSTSASLPVRVLLSLAWNTMFLTVLTLVGEPASPHCCGSPSMSATDHWLSVR